jgi:hypothetical protein
MKFRLPQATTENLFYIKINYNLIFVVSKETVFHNNPPSIMFNLKTKETLMKNILSIATLNLLLGLLLTACGDNPNSSNTTEKAAEATAQPEKTMNKEAATNEAKAIAKNFIGALKPELEKAMKAGGPVNALEVCNTKAIEITTQSGKDQNAQISRVSLKNRNPSNTPNDWQKAVLEDFDARAAKGEDVKKMGFSEIIDNNGKKQIRFMKALPTGEVCLKCHGKSITPEVQAKITELYPEDKATGYEKGQVRGAIVVIKDLN